MVTQDDQPMKKVKVGNKKARTKVSEQDFATWKQESWKFRIIKSNTQSPSNK